MPPTVALTPPRTLGGFVGLVENAVAADNPVPSTVTIDPGVRLAFWTKEAAFRTLVIPAWAFSADKTTMKAGRKIGGELRITRVEKRSMRVRIQPTQGASQAPSQAPNAR